jgi:hypothetical protein
LKKGLILPFSKGTDQGSQELFAALEWRTEEVGEDAMWISLFTLVCGVAVCLSVAAVMMERGGLQLLRR